MLFEHFLFSWFLAWNTKLQQWYLLLFHSVFNSDKRKYRVMARPSKTLPSARALHRWPPTKPVPHLWWSRDRGEHYSWFDSQALPEWQTLYIWGGVGCEHLCKLQRIFIDNNTYGPSSAVTSKNATKQKVLWVDGVRYRSLYIFLPFSSFTIVWSSAYIGERK